MEEVDTACHFSGVLFCAVLASGRHGRAPRPVVWGRVTVARPQTQAWPTSSLSVLCAPLPPARPDLTKLANHHRPGLEVTEFRCFGYWVKVEQNPFVEIRWEQWQDDQEGGQN